MDLALLILQYQSRHVLEQSLKAVVYSTKLKLEFAILNKLVNITQSSNNEIFLKPLEDSGTEAETGGRTDSVLGGGEGAGAGVWAKDFEKGGGGQTEYIERAASGATYSSSGGDHHAHAQTSLTPLGRTETADQQQRRRTIEMDDYADACRSLA